jgi:hypothetical protein
MIDVDNWKKIRKLLVEYILYFASQGLETKSFWQCYLTVWFVIESIPHWWRDFGLFLFRLCLRTRAPQRTIKKVIYGSLAKVLRAPPSTQ